MRACNIYGIGDYNPQRLIPGVVSSYLQNRPFIIRNQGLDLREYIHVSDVVSAYIHILEYIETVNKVSAFNISSGDRYQTIEIFNLIQEIIQREIPSEVKMGESFEIKRQFMDSSLLKNSTNWTPTKNIRDDLREIVTWYTENL